MRVCSLLQPAHLPWEGFFQIMSASEMHFMTDVQFSKPSWQMRNRIRTPRKLVGEIPRALRTHLLIGEMAKGAVRDPETVEAIKGLGLEPLTSKSGDYYNLMEYDKQTFNIKGRGDELLLEEEGDVLKAYSSGWVWLTVPTINVPLKSAKRFMVHIKIDNRYPWQLQHLHAISSNYSESKWYDEYFPELEAIYSERWTHLVPLNLRLIEWLKEKLGIKNPTFIEGEIPYDRDTGHTDEGKTQRLINFCDAVGADCYLEPGGGSAFIDEEMFQMAGIELRWAHAQHIPYNQLHEGFVPQMSALDLLFCLGPRAKNRMSVMWYDDLYVEDYMEPMGKDAFKPPLAPGKMIRGDD